MATLPPLHMAADIHKIKNLHFLTEDALPTANAQMRRVADVLKAVALQDHQEVLLSVQTTEGVERIQTIVVAAGDDFVLIDTGFSLPMRSIEKIEFMKS
jgi:hypothetical protein